ncbi:guanylyl cyclase [Naegleria gruberi]|uniref:Guanylyl cyclase n=1 Tax=Naegleria gruberi TaxID=5762 RepID=D2VV59_NAEGR|nr:guanylyl cyclase [Naegleria gruberi]EFC39251.1 guanylyl cyclase [Naegleria gruberi]|eukprot:XP_002671995.1 guanylyl cyclase [Naegleria gruberi strain NEG-M]
MGASCSCASAVNVLSHEKKQQQIIDAPQKRKVYRDEKSKQSIVSEKASSNHKISSSPPKDEETTKASPKQAIDQQEKKERTETKNSSQSLNETVTKKSSNELYNDLKPNENMTNSVSQDLKKVDSVAFSFVKSLLPKRFTFSSDIEKKEQDQLEILSSYLPQHLLYQLEDSESTDLIMGTSYETCVLMIDISGFTPLTESLSKQPNGVELLTKYINAYFTGLIEYIYSYSGDIEKFAGDGQNKSLKELVLSAMECALSIQKNDKLRFFKVNDSISLQIHCGISIGSLTTHHIGGVSNYYLRISSGHALLEMGSALGNSKVGELCLTKEAYEIVKNSCTCKKVEGIEEEAYLAIDLAGTVVEKSNLEPVNITPKLSQAIKQFVSPSVRNKIMARQEDWLNEIKPLSIGFLSVIDSNNYSSVIESNNAYQDYIFLVQHILEKYEGFIANLLSDEKGTILVFCFGYPLAHTNDPLRAVKAGIEIREQLSELGIKGGLGISTGKCFIGNVGSMYRKEFTIYGDKVNLSARLMKESEKHDGMVLCEEDTYSKLKGAKIEILDPIKVKGKSNLINICKVLNGEIAAKQSYYNAKKSGSELVTELEVDDKIGLIGRDSVFKAIEAIVEAKVKQFEDVNAVKDSSKFITIRGDVGLGKTDLLTRLSDIWKTKIATVYISPPQFETPFYSMLSNVRICFCEHIYKKKNIELDYSKVESIFKALTIQEKEELVREKTDESDITYMYLLNNIFGVKFKSNGELLTKEQIVDISARIMCKFLVNCWVSFGYGSQPWFMLYDDYQYTDPFTRKLVTLFLDVYPLTQTMIGVYASRIMDNDSEIKDIEQKKIDFDFWNERADLVINLKPFSKAECKEYLKLFYKASDVHADALEFVFEKSQGNQLFTKMICSFLKDNKRYLIEDETLKLKNTMLDVEIVSSMSAYVQRKIDRLDDETKIALKIASVCGMEFDLNVIEAAFPNDSSINREGNIEGLLTTLFVNDLLVKNGSQYKFRSSLIHSIVYESVPKDQKREIHLKLANLFIEKIENDNSEEVQQTIFLNTASLHYSYYYDDIILEEVLTGDPLEKEVELHNLCVAYHLIEKAITLFDRKSKQIDTIRELGLAIIRILGNVVKYWKENSKADHMNSPRLGSSLTLRDFIKNTKELCNRRFEDLKMIDSSPYIFAKSLHQMKEHLAKHLLHHSEFIRINSVGDNEIKELAEQLIRKGIEICPPENKDLLFHLHLQQWFFKFLNDQTDEALGCLPSLAEIASDNPKLNVFYEIAASFSNYTRGCFEQVRLHSKKVIEIYSQDPDNISQYSIGNFRNMDALVFIISYAARSSYALGKFEEARAYFELGRKRSLEINHPASLVHFLTFSCSYLLQSDQIDELECIANKGLESDLVPPHQQLFQKFYLNYVKFRKTNDNHSIVCQEKDILQLSLINKMESLYASISHYNSPSLVVNYAILDSKLKYLELISRMETTACPSIFGVLKSFDELMEHSLKSNQENMFGDLWRLKGEMKVIEMKLKLEDSSNEQAVLANVEDSYNTALKYANDQKANGIKVKILISYLKSLQSFSSLQSTKSTIEKITRELKETCLNVEIPTFHSYHDIEVSILKH